MSAAIPVIDAPIHRRPREAQSARTLVTLVTLVGGAVALAGVSLPWLSFYAGLHTIQGVDGGFGATAAVLAAGGIAAGLAFALSGEQLARWFIGFAGFGVTAIAGWSGLNALATIGNLRDPLLVVELGPGTLVLGVGGGLMAATMFMADTVPAVRGAASAGRLRGILTASLVAGGIVHVGVGQDHLTTSTLIGMAMIVAGAAQIAVAAGIRALPASRLALTTSLGLSALLVAAYALAVTVGLPVEPHPHLTDMPGHAAGHVEAVSAIGLVTVGIEVLGVAIAAALLRGRDRPSDAC